MECFLCYGSDFNYNPYNAFVQVCSKNFKFNMIVCQHHSRCIAYDLYKLNTLHKKKVCIDYYIKAEKLFFEYKQNHNDEYYQKMNLLFDKFKDQIANPEPDLENIEYYPLEYTNIL